MFQFFLQIATIKASGGPPTVRGVNYRYTPTNKLKSPNGWKVKPSKKGGGIVYQDPVNPHNSMRVMPGNPNSPNPAQQNSYVVFKRNGVAHDANGVPLKSATDPAAHIPLKQFDIGKMPTK